MYILYLDENFKPFFANGFAWGKKTKTRPSRDLTDTADGLTKEQKCAHVDMMLGQIANYATVISRTLITRNSANFADIWNQLREYYGFLNTGSRFLDLATIKLDVGERPEDLYQRILSFFEDNLQVNGSSLTHHGVTPDADEEMTATVENTTVLLWLERLHVALPALIKQRYGAELRNKSLASIKSEISLALDSLLDEVKSNADSKVCRTFGGARPRSEGFSDRDGKSKRSDRDRRRGKNSSDNSGGGKFCCLCRASNRPDWDSHYLIQCKFLPESDRRRLTKVRNIEVYDSEDLSCSETSISNDSDEASDGNSSGLEPADIQSQSQSSVAVARRVSVRKSPVLQCFYKHHLVSVCLDTGSESNFISLKLATDLELKYKDSKQGAVQADAKTRLSVVGEVKFPLVRGASTFTCDALVVEEDLGELVGGEPFLETNDIFVRSSKKMIYIGDKEVISYASS